MNNIEGIEWMWVHVGKYKVLKSNSVETLDRCTLTFWLFKKPPTGNPPMRRERVIVLKAENVQALALDVARWMKWLEAHTNTEFLWSKISEEKGELLFEIHYMSDDVDTPEE